MGLRDRALYPERVPETVTVKEARIEELGALYL
jgi:hypothetical protein